MMHRLRFFGRRERFVALRSKVLKKRKRRHASLKSLKPVLFVLAGLAVLGGGIYGGMRLFHRLGKFPIDQIIVQGNRVLTRDEILTLAAARSGLNLFTYDIYDAKRALEREPYIKRATVTREIPDTVRIEVAERQPVALVEWPRPFLVDSAGVCLPLHSGVETEGLPLIVGLGPGRHKPRERISAAPMQSALTVLKHYRASELKQLITILRIDIRRPEDIRLIVAEGPATQRGCLIHCGPDRYDQRLANCIAILKRSRRQWSEIDLRPMRRIPAVASGSHPSDNSVTPTTNP